MDKANKIKLQSSGVTNGLISIRYNIQIQKQQIQMIKSQSITQQQSIFENDLQLSKNYLQKSISAQQLFNISSTKKPDIRKGQISQLSQNTNYNQLQKTQGNFRRKPFKPILPLQKMQTKTFQYKDLVDIEVLELK